MSGRVRRQLDVPESATAFQRFLPMLAVVWLAIYWTWFFSTELPNNPTWSRLMVALELPELYAALLSSHSVPEAPSGWRYLPQRLDLLAGAVFLGLTAFSLGRLLLRALAAVLRTTEWDAVRTALPASDRAALAGGLGISALSLVTLALGLAGRLWQPLFAALFVAMVVAEGVCSWRERTVAFGSRRPAVRDAGGPPRWLRRVCLAICVPFLLCMLLGSLQPPTDFDVREYHLQGPKEYFQAGRVQFLEHNVYTSFPFLTEMLSLAAMTLRGDWYRGALTGQAVLMLFAPLTALGVYGVARRTAGPTAGWLAAVAYLTTPWTYRISIIAYTEGAMCCYVILPLLAFLIWRERTQTADVVPGASAYWLLIVGFLAGSAVSTKYPGMVLVAIPFALAVMLAVLRTPAPLPLATSGSLGAASRLRRVVLAAALYGAGVAAAFGPWMAKNLFETGNPVYPLMYTVFGGRDWSPEMNEKWRRAHGPPPGNFFHHAREDVIGLLGYNDWHSPLLIGLAPLALAIPARRRLVGLSAYAGVIVACWFLLTHRIDRFWVPVNPLLAALAGCGLAVVLGRAEDSSPETSASARRAVPAFTPATRAAALLLSAFAVVYNFAFITTGLSGANSYLMEQSAAREMYRARSIALLESVGLPDDARVLFVGEAEVFDATFDHRYNTVFDESLLERWAARRIDADSWELLPAEEIREHLRREGITHVFVNWNEVLRYRLTYGYTDFVTPARIAKIAARAGWREATVIARLGRRDFSQLNPREQQEVRDWAPQLLHPHSDGERMTLYQLFVVDR